MIIFFEASFEKENLYCQKRFLEKTTKILEVIQILFRAECMNHVTKISRLGKVRFGYIRLG